MEKGKFVIDLSDNYDKESFKSSLTDLRSVITSLVQDGSETDKREIGNALSFIQQLEEAANKASDEASRPCRVTPSGKEPINLDWLFEYIHTINVWIEGLAETMQYIALADSCGYEDEKKDAIFQVAGTREFLQKLRIMIDR